MNFEISEGKTVLYFYGNVINLGGGEVVRYILVLFRNGL